MQNILKKYQDVFCVCRLIYNGRFVTCYAFVFTTGNAYNWLLFTIVFVSV
jgi:hypothetical protein